MNEILPYGFQFSMTGDTIPFLVINVILTIGVIKGILTKSYSNIFYKYFYFFVLAYNIFLIFVSIFYVVLPLSSEAFWGVTFIVWGIALAERFFKKKLAVQ